MPSTPTPAPERRAAASRPEPCGACSAPRNVQELHQQHAPMGAVDLHQARLRSTLHPRTLLAHLLGGGQNPHPAAGHEIFAACLKGLQPPVLVAVAFVVQAPACGIGPLCPDLIDQPLRGSLRLQLSDRQWVLCRCVNGLTIEHQRVARVLTVVRNDQSVAHDRDLLSPLLSRDFAA
jgi:hypothetical protein